MQSHPSGWQIKSLGEVSEFITTGKTPSTQVTDYFKGKILWFTPSDIGLSKNLNLSERTLTEKAIVEGKAVLFPKDTLLITCIGNIGRVGILTCNGSTNQQITGIKFDSRIDVNYAYYWFRKNSHHLIYKANKAIVPILNNRQLREILIEYPPLPIQKQIAEILEKADQAKQKRLEANKLTEQFLQSSFIEMFGDPLKNPKRWELKNFGNVFKTIRYGTGSPPTYVEKGIPFIRATNIKNNQIVDKNLVFISEEDARKIQKCELKEGDLIVVRSGVNTGAAAVVPKNHNGSFAAYDLIIELEKYSAIFYSCLINSEYGRVLIEPLSRRAGQPHLNAEQLKGIEFYYPPIPLQQKFAELVQKTETLKEKQKESEIELENLFNSLMQKAFKDELVFSEEKLKLTTTDLHAGILTKIIYIHSLSPVYKSTLGHVKAEKICHIIESYLELDLGRTPVRIAAGPADFKHLKKVEHRANKKNWFSVCKRENTFGFGYKYILEKNSKYILNDISTLFGSKETELNRIINSFLHQDTHRAEVVATVFAAWNDLLIEGKDVIAKDIVCEAREKWTKNKLKIEEEKFYKSIEWLKKHNLVPKGKGKHTISNG
jgi:type I restriction enzyme S subunit